MANDSSRSADEVDPTREAFTVVFDVRGRAGRHQQSTRTSIALLLSDTHARVKDVCPIDFAISAVILRRSGDVRRYGHLRCTRNFLYSAAVPSGRTARQTGGVRIYSALIVWAARSLHCPRSCVFRPAHNRAGPRVGGRCGAASGGRQQWRKQSSLQQHQTCRHRGSGHRVRMKADPDCPSQLNPSPTATPLLSHTSSQYGVCKGPRQARHCHQGPRPHRVSRWCHPSPCPIPRRQLTVNYPKREGSRQGG